MEVQNQDPYFLPSSRVVHQPNSIQQQEINDMICDLYLFIRQAEVRESRRQQWYYLYNQNKVKKWQSFTLIQKTCFITILYDGRVRLSVWYKSMEHFTDGSKSIVKVVIIHNGKRCPSVQIAYLNVLKGKDETMEPIKYTIFKWKVCGELK